MRSYDGYYTQYKFFKRLTMSHNNAKILKDGLKKGYEQIVKYLYKQMYDMCERLLVEVPLHRQYLGFTGNTQTSYACGLYVDGTLEGIVTQKNWNSPPVHRKVKIGEWVYLRNPYEGRSRSIRGTSQVTDNFGLDTSIRFLRSFNAKKNTIQIVMTTGTEYSAYLEAAAGLDVLTGTYEAAKVILAQGFKPMQT